MDQYVIKDNQKLRCGYTTGSCAAGAAQRATAVLLGADLTKGEKIVLDTPKGIRLELPIECMEQGSDWVSCAVKKDGGDDPDITTGTLIFAEVSWQEQKQEKPSIRDQLKAAAKTQPEKKSPVKSKTHDMEL